MLGVVAGHGRLQTWGWRPMRSTAMSCGVTSTARRALWAPRSRRAQKSRTWSGPVGTRPFYAKAISRGLSKRLIQPRAVSPYSSGFQRTISSRGSLRVLASTPKSSWSKPMSSSWVRRPRTKESRRSRGQPTRSGANVVGGDGLGPAVPEAPFRGRGEAGEGAALEARGARLSGRCGRRGGAGRRRRVSPEERRRGGQLKAPSVQTLELRARIGRPEV